MTIYVYDNWKHVHEAGRCVFGDGAFLHTSTTVRCARKVDHTGAHVQQYHVAHSNCCGKWLRSTTQLYLSRGWNWVLGMSRPYICVQLSSSFYAQQIIGISSRMQPMARLCQSTNSWSCNKPHNVAQQLILGCNRVPDYVNRRIHGVVINSIMSRRASVRIRANARGPGYRHRFRCDACWALADTVGANPRTFRAGMAWATSDKKSAWH